MKVTEIEMCLGAHKNLKIDCDSPVFGITGPNGCGKSTILAGINFAFTGKLPDENATYIPNGEKQAFVKIKFEHNGQKGSILRYASSNKREMYWDGADKPITAAKEIDQTIDAIFGVDKHVFSNAAFINQGELNNVLFGSTAERKTLFIKLLSLTYYEQRAQKIYQKITELSKNLVSYEETRAEFAEQFKRQVEEVEDLEKKLKSMTDFSAVIETLNSIKVLEGKIEESKQRKQDYTNKLTEAKAKFNDLYKDADNFLKVIDQKIEQIKRDQKDNEDFLYGADLCVNLEEQRKKLAARASDLQTSLANISKELEQLPVEISVQEAIFNATEALKNQEAHRNYKEKFDNLTKHITDTKTRLENAHEEYKDITSGALDFNTDCVQKLQAEVQRQTDWIKLQSQILHAGCFTEEGNTKCPECGLVLSDQQKLSLDSLEQLKTKHEETKKEYEEIVKTQIHLKERKQKYTNEVTICETLLESARKNLTSLLLEKPTSQYDESQTEEDLKNIISENTAILQKITRLNNKLSQDSEFLKSVKSDELEVTEKLQNVPDRVKNVVLNGEFNRAEYSRKSVILRDDLERLQQAKTEYNVLVKTIKDLEDAVQAAQELLESRLAAIKDKQSSGDLKAAIDKFNESDLNILKLELVDETTKYHTLEGEIKSKVSQVETTKRKLAEIDQKIKENEKRKTLIDDLTLAREALSKDGIALTYIKSKFEEISGLISENLETLDANYVVRVSQTEDLAFEFTLNTDTTGVWMPMKKLSGGQKVKLSIAFLLAVQQTICAEVNFLNLDEPSTHLDTNSTESLAELLNKMEGELESTGGQLWVVDHNVNLERAFKKSLNFYK